MRTKFNGKIKRFSALDASYQVEEHLSKPRLFSRTNELKLAATQLADKQQNRWCKVLWILKGSSSISQYHLWSRQSLPCRSLAQGRRCWTVTATCPLLTALPRLRSSCSGQPSFLLWPSWCSCSYSSYFTSGFNRALHRKGLPACKQYSWFPPVLLISFRSKFISIVGKYMGEIELW